MYIWSKRQKMCPPGYYQSANGPMVTHALEHTIHQTIHHVSKCMSYHGGHWQIGNNREGTVSVFLTTHISYAQLNTVR